MASNNSRQTHQIHNLDTNSSDKNNSTHDNKPEDTTQPSTPGNELVRLRSTVPAIQTDENKNVDCIDPIKAKALLEPMKVTHKQNQLYSISDQDNTYTIDLNEKNCTCNSSLPQANDYCEHIQRLSELDSRDSLPGPGFQQYKSDDSTTHKDTEQPRKQNKKQVSCDECGKNIGVTTTPEPEIAYATCNVCALTNTNLYHLYPETEHKRELVKFNELICTGTVDTYYPENNVISVYEFFADHEKTRKNDSVVKIHRRCDEDKCDGIIFTSSTTAVPTSLLTAAQEQLDSPVNSELTQPNNENLIEGVV